MEIPGGILAILGAVVAEVSLLVVFARVTSAIDKLDTKHPSQDVADCIIETIMKEYQLVSVMIIGGIVSVAGIAMVIAPLLKK